MSNPTNMFYARVVHKHDIEDNWIKAEGFIPLEGEIVIYDKDTTHNYQRIKIGDGETKVSNLPFYDGIVATANFVEENRDKANNVELIDCTFSELVTAYKEGKKVLLFYNNSAYFTISGYFGGNLFFICDAPELVKARIHFVYTDEKFGTLTNLVQYTDDIDENYEDKILKYNDGKAVWSETKFSDLITIDTTANIEGEPETFDADTLGGYLPSDFALALEAVKKTTNITTENTNLNDYNTDGVYYFPAEYAPINRPIGTDGWLMVFNRTNITKQMWFRQGTVNSTHHQIFIRGKNAAGVWADWVELMTSKGGTFVGDITLKGDPTNNLHAATKQYVDKMMDNVNIDGTFTSPIKIKNTSLTLENNYRPTIYFNNNDSKEVNKIYSDFDYNRLNFSQTPADQINNQSPYKEIYYLPNPKEGLDKSYWYQILTARDPVAIAQGGTGATNATQALINLGAASASHKHTASEIGAATSAEHNIKTYTTLTQLGLTKTSTLTEVTNALPANSRLLLQCADVDATVWNLPHTYGTLEFVKKAGARSYLTLYGKRATTYDTQRDYIALCDSNGIPTGTWTKVMTADGGTFTDLVYMPTHANILGNSWNSVRFLTADKKNRSEMMISDNNVIHFNHRETGSAYAERYKLPDVTKGLTADVWHNIITSKGGTFTGDVTFNGSKSTFNTQAWFYKNPVIETSTSIADNGRARLTFQVKQTDNNITSSGHISVYDDHDAATNGTNMVIQSNGNMIIGSGESPTTYYTNNLLDSTTEKTYIISDNDISLITNANTIANAKTATVNTDGTITTSGANRSAAHVRNTEVRTGSASGTLQTTGNIIFVRK